MPLSSSWRDAFPYENTQQVVNLISNTWDFLVSRNTPRFNPSSPEPHLTQFLRSVLKTEKITAGLSGDFACESVDADPDLNTGQLKNRSRADIKYFSDRAGVDLTFEFKKLKPTADSIKKYHGEDGMLRFVSGKYSRDQPLAFMVGLIAKDPENCILKLKNAIGTSAAIKELKLIEVEPGKWIQDPSVELPPRVRFDSTHSRAHLENRPHIVLCHLFFLYGDAVAKN